MKVVLTANTSWYLVNYRAGLIGFLKKQGYDVITVSPRDEHSPRLGELGCVVRSVPLRSYSVNPLSDLRTLVGYLKLFFFESPAAILAFTAKPVIYGAVAARMLRIPAVLTITGLGTAFIHKNWVSAIVRILYRCALTPRNDVIFQNREDRRLFEDLGIVRRGSGIVVPGSGIDLERFTVEKPTSGSEKECERFLYLGRVLYDKGIKELIEATRMIKKEYPEIHVRILGSRPSENASVVRSEDLDLWEKSGLIEYIPAAPDVRPFLKDCDCVVLPSYREGLPRSLLEAAAVGKPAIATNVPGCQEVVVAGETGLLCKVKDAHSLASAMKRFIRMSRGERARLGQNARRMVEVHYNEKTVLNTYHQLITHAVKSAEK